MSDITFSQAISNYEENNNRNAELFKKTLQEIKESNFSVLRHMDIQFYANTLNETNPDRKAEKYTANDVRRMNIRHTEDTLAMLSTFEDDPTDDIFDFF